MDQGMKILYYERDTHAKKCIPVKQLCLSCIVCALCEQNIIKFCEMLCKHILL